MRNDIVLKIVSEYDQEIPQSQTADNPRHRFCTWHTMLNVFFSPGVYPYFHRQLSDNFILSQKYQRLGCMSIK